MKKLNTLLGLMASTVLVASVFNVQAAELVKAEPINQKELMQTVKLELTRSFNETKLTLLKESTAVESLIVKQVNNKQLPNQVIAKVSYIAE
jgi:hypothetical protein